VRWSSIDTSSLQLRLTLGVTFVAVLGLGGIAGWTVWKMQHMLMLNHEQDVMFVANHLPSEVEQFSSSDHPEQGLQQAVNTLSSRDLLLWVKGNNGQILAQSSALRRSSLRHELTALSSMPTHPELFEFHNHYIVICSGKLRAWGEPLGWFYLAKDVTRDYVTLLSFSQSIRIWTLLAIALIVATVAILIWRSLLPLRQVNQLVAVPIAGNLKNSRLNEEQMPSEVRALAQNWNQLLEKLSQTGEQQRQLANDISHELRTPLSLVYGYLQSTLRRGNNLTPHQQEALQIAVSETERTIQLLQNLLDLARAESLDMPFQLKPMILDDLVTEVAETARQSSQRTVAVELEATPVTVYADRNYLKQVFLQLVDNALHHSQQDEPILLKLGHLPGWGTVQVCDRGCGIPLTQQTRIFEPFYRVDPSRSRETGGVGLGLSIVKSLVEGMGGQVAVHSEPGRGSTFLVRLPDKASEGKHV
jgi:signal transduction histidine kinase